MPTTSLRSLAVLLVGGLLLAACERPFIEVSTPDVRIVAPDLSVVQTNRFAEVRVAASSFRDVESVTLNTLPMTLDPSNQQWFVDIEFSRGLNTLILRATDVDDATSVDTTYAVYLPFQLRPTGPTLPEPRGGHTVNFLDDGSLLAVGGAPDVRSLARDDVFILPPGERTFQRQIGGLRHARIGHTTTRLPDGRLLVVGGSVLEEIRTVDDLVEAVEVYDPSTGLFSTIPVIGQPIRRAFHTALLRTTSAGSVLDLFGGRGDIRYEPSPRLGVRRDLRSFRVYPDSLVALNTPRSAPFLPAAIAGHSFSSLSFFGPNLTGRYLIEGAFFEGGAVDTISFIVDYSRLPEIFFLDAPAPTMPRTRHATAPVADLVTFFGGHQGSPDTAFGFTEVYSATADRFFRLPQPEASIKRFGHTATNLSAQRILLLGGFSPDGTAFSAAELFETAPPD